MHIIKWCPCLSTNEGEHHPRLEENRQRLWGGTINFRKKLIMGFVQKLLNELKLLSINYFLTSTSHSNVAFHCFPGNGFLQIPWQRVTNPYEPSIVYIMNKRNFKVYDNVCEISKSTQRLSSSVETETYSGVIRVNEFPIQWDEHIKPGEISLTTWNAGKNTVTIVGFIGFIFLIGTIIASVNFFVTKQLKTERCNQTALLACGNG